MSSSQGSISRSKVLALALASVFGLGMANSSPVQAAAANMAASPAPVVAHATALRSGDAFTGALAASHTLHIQVALRLQHRDELQTNVHAALHGQGPWARKHLSGSQFVDRYGPTQLQVLKVTSFLRQAGFSNIKVAPNRLLVSADGSAATAERAFDTSLASVTTRTGRHTFANTAPVHVPQALQDIVLSVVGLQDVHRAHPSIMAVPQSVSGHNPVDFSSIYGGSGQTTGAGVTVGILTSGSLSQTKTDLDTFTSNNGLATVTTQTVNTNGTSSDTSGVGEWNLDSQDVVGAAGGEIGTLIFYNIPNLSNSNLTADINTAVSANAAKIINVSLGECETSAQSDGSASAQDQAFQQAVAQGQTFSISTGDSGADECGDGGTTPSWPAASQYVVAVAGTTLNTSGSSYASETVWTSSGGSESTFEAQPSWQSGLFSGSHRGVADVAFDGDPSSGAQIIVNGSTQQYGGTSLSAPIFAGLWARIIAEHGTDVGFAAPLLYDLPAGDFHDITSGNNGGESAGSGYDLASGRGSLILSSAIGDIGSGSGGGGGGGGSTELQNGVPVTGLSGSSGTFSDTYTVTIPSGASNLVIAESGGTGDADLYVQFGSAPDTSSYDCRPYKSGNNESCSFSAPQAGVYYVRIRGYQAYSGVSLEATWDTSGGGGGGGSGSYDNPTNVSVPDGGTASSSISVSGEGSSGPTDLQVHVEIVHTYRGDLRVTLIAPNGSSVVLKSPDGSDGTDNVNQTYSVDASGIDPNGTWQLQVDDVYSGDTGYLDDWSLTF